MYNALFIARYIISYCASQRRHISNLQLQKMLYFVQAEFLVAVGEACFYNRIEAWDFGPVVPDVYLYYKVYGSSSIPSSGDLGTMGLEHEHVGMINGIIDECLTFTPAQLVSITHRQSPWKDAYANGKSTEITQQSIRDYFSQN